MGRKFRYQPKNTPARRQRFTPDADPELHPGFQNSDRYILSPANLLRLQETVGNQAVIHRLALPGETVVQRDVGDFSPYPSAPGIGIPIPGQMFPPVNQPIPLAETGKQGPKATVDNLRPLVEIRLEAWKRAAERGIQLFTNAELRNLIDKNDFDATGFLGSLIGNVIWAAASFSTGGGAFAISLAGIGVLTVAPLPKVKTPDTSFEIIEKQAQQYVDAIHGHLLGQVSSSCENVIKEFPEKGVNAVLHHIMEASFKPNFLSSLENPPWRTEIREEAVRNSFQDYATRRLKNFRDITSGGHSGPGVIRIKDLATLALAKTEDSGNWSVIKLIPSEDHDYALELGKKRWKELGGWWEGVDENPLKSGALFVISLGARQPEQNWVQWTKEKPIPEFNSDQIWGGIPGA